MRGDKSRQLRCAALPVESFSFVRDGEIQNPAHLQDGADLLQPADHIWNALDDVRG
jgi:hypothetical protein